MDFHITFKCRLCIWDHRLRIITEDCIFFHFCRHTPACQSFFHLMHFIKRLRKKFQIASFGNLKDELLNITFHDSGRSTQRHNGNSAIFFWKWCHNFIRCSKGKIFQYGFSIPASGADRQSGYFSEFVFCQMFVRLSFLFFKNASYILAVK